MEKEITIKSERVFEGKIINLRIDTVELQNQKYAKREIVEHKGAAAILAIDNENKVVLIKQYRKAAEDFLFEIPAGKLEIDEDPIECANRELIEETGLCPNKIEKLMEFYSSPGFCDEKIYLFKATELNEVERNLDEDEDIDIFKVTIEEAKEMVRQNKIMDAKTIVAIMSL